MEIGLLWYDDSKLDFAVKVLEAAERYMQKYGAPPNCCYVHPQSLPDDRPRTNGIKVVASPAVLPDHFWIGIRLGPRMRETHS
jgi:hypothetical protein